MRVTAPRSLRIGRSFSSSSLRGLALSFTAYSVVPIFCVPAGNVRFWLPMAVLTSTAVRPCARNASGCRSTCTWRVAPPNGYGTEAPAIVATCARMIWLPKSKSCDSVCFWLAIASCTIGTLDALYFMISGGVVPGGICLRFDCA